MNIVQKTKPQPDTGPSRPDAAPVEPPDKRPRRSRLATLFGIVAAVLIVVGTYSAVKRLAAPGASNRPSAEAAAQPVGAAVIGRGDIRIILDALGTVTALATVTVRTQISGQLIEVGFKEGDNVKKGDFLAQIDPRPYQAALHQAEGQLAHDQGLLDQARADLARYQSLAKTNAVPRQQTEDQAFLVKQYEGSVQTDQAQIDTQKLNLAYCHIVSPVDGRTGLRLVDPGNYVQASDSTGIVMVTQMQPISVIMTIPEDELPELMVDLDAGEKPQALAYDRANVKRLAIGDVATLDNQIDTTTGTVKLRALFANVDGRLFPNQFVNIRILVRTLQNVVTVPNAAIQRGAPGTYVFVIKEDNTVAARPIMLGPSDGGVSEVTNGLAAGERVVVDGADRLRDGARVTIAAPGGRDAVGATPGGG
jgi:multidrug efflux system membrane fusion protein